MVIHAAMTASLPNFVDGVPNLARSAGEMAAGGTRYCPQPRPRMHGEKAADLHELQDLLWLI
jgi:hypothetical protein